MDFIGFSPRINICYTYDLYTWPFRYWCFHNWLSFILALAFRKCTNRSNGLCHSKVCLHFQIGFSTSDKTHTCFFPKIKTVNFCSKVQKGSQSLTWWFRKHQVSPKGTFSPVVFLGKGVLNLSIKVQSLELIHANDFFMAFQSLLSSHPLHKILVFWIYFKIDSIRKEILL